MGVPWYPYTGGSRPMVVVPGEYVECEVTIQYRGPGAHLWVGICPSPHGTRSDIYQFIGKMVDFAPSGVWGSYPIVISGNLDLNPPEPDQSHECYVLIATSAAIAGEVEGDWMEYGGSKDVFDFIHEDEFRIVKATFR